MRYSRLDGPLNAVADVRLIDAVDGEDLLVPNPNHQYVPDSSSEEEDNTDKEDDEDENGDEGAQNASAS